MPRLSAPLAGLLLALGLSQASLAADPVNPAVRRAHAERAPHPELSLTEETRGERAVHALGKRLRDVAAWHGRTEDEFARLLRLDARLRIDRRGRLLAVETMEAPLASLPADEKSAIDGSLLPLDQTFLLHSRRGSKRTIYLNFRGAALSNTVWNSSAATINAAPFDLDGIPNSFNAAELQRIQAIWQRVAEDFAPFEVDVTTEAPPAAALARATSADQQFGTMVLITNSSGVYSCTCGGIAYVGVFDDLSERYKPAMVFYNQLGAGSEKFVAEAISHEAGHNMGLLHDGNASTGYYAGHGSGATAWAPIMGVGYYKGLSQWSKGEYANANNLQDDFKVMEANGLPIRLDDHGDVPGAATKLTAVSSGGVSSHVETGVIERASDVDQFSFAAAAGNVSVILSPAQRAPNLDALIELRDASGKLLASANPVEALSASLSFNLPLPGTYYVSVRGTGKGEPLTSGYSAYGSLGQYKLSVQALTPLAIAPVAQLSASALSATAPAALNFSAAGSSDADGRIVGYDWDFGDGSRASGASAVSHAFALPGVYVVQLRVTDDSVMSASQSISVTVNPAPTILPSLAVADISMSAVGSLPWKASATVRLQDGKGRPVAGAKVVVSWGGKLAGSASAISNANGVASFQSVSMASGGVVSLSVADLSLTGYQYDPLKNIESSAVLAH